MTLIPIKNFKPDMRMVEYDQAVIRLGLEKAGLEKEVGWVKNDLRQLNISLGIVKEVFFRNWEKLNEEERKEVGDRTKVLDDYKKLVAFEEKKLGEIIANKQEVIILIQEKEKQKASLDNLIQNRNQKLQEISDGITDLESKRVLSERAKFLAMTQQRSVQEKLKETVDDLREVSGVVIKTREEIEKKNRELAELNEIISILQSANKQGLDMVASFEGERSRLKDKEDFLIRKEKDLVKYEKRVQKSREASGNDIPMVFT